MEEHRGDALSRAAVERVAEHAADERLAVRAAGGWQLPPGPYRIDVAGHAADPDALTLTVDLPS